MTLDGPDAPDAGGSALADLDLVLFGAGVFRIGVEACRVRASRPPARLDDAMVEIEDVLGLSPALAGTPSGERHVVMFKGAGTDEIDRAVRVDGPVELVSLAPERIHPLPPLLAARVTLRGLRGLALDDGGIALLVDVGKTMAKGTGGTPAAEGR